MLVTAGYWNYISKETQTLETVSVGETEQNTTDENLGDAQLVSNNELIYVESYTKTDGTKVSGYYRRK